MTNKSKRKGSDWERELAGYLNDNLKGASFKRIPGSGAIGTIMNESFLTGDVSGKVDGFPKKLKIECKTGYGGKNQMTIQREWLEKIKDQSELDYSFPVLAGKFLGARNFKYFFILSDKEFLFLIRLIQKLANENSL